MLVSVRLLEVVEASKRRDVTNVLGMVFPSFSQIMDGGGTPVAWQFIVTFLVTSTCIFSGCPNTTGGTRADKTKNCSEFQILVHIALHNRFNQYKPSPCWDLPCTCNSEGAKSTPCKLLTLQV